MVSYGSAMSWSDTPAATTVTVQASLLAKSTSGSRVKLVGPPETVAVCEPLVAQEIVNQLPDTSTGSSKLIVTFELTGTPTASSTGTVASTAGAGSALCGVTLRSSTASPSSAPLALKSCQRIHNPLPLGTLRPTIEPKIVARFAAAFPSRAPTMGAVLIGLEKSRESTSTHEPLVRLVASRLYWKSILSSRAAAILPMRHCSPVYPM